MSESLDQQEIGIPEKDATQPEVRDGADLLPQTIDVDENLKSSEENRNA